MCYGALRILLKNSACKASAGVGPIFHIHGSLKAHTSVPQNTLGLTLT